VSVDFSPLSILSQAQGQLPQTEACDKHEGKCVPVTRLPDEQGAEQGTFPCPSPHKQMHNVLKGPSDTRHLTLITWLQRQEAQEAQGLGQTQIPNLPPPRVFVIQLYSLILKIAS
jgi:hypothetical protein